MARIRSIHPSACISETLASISPSEERTFWRLLTHCDDQGRAIANPRLVKAAIYPLHDDMSAKAVEADLHGLSRAGLILFYQVDGKEYLSVTSWHEFQHPKSPSPSKLPEPPPESPRASPPIPQDFHASTPGLPQDFPRPYPQELGEGEGEGEGGRSSTPPAPGRTPTPEPPQAKSPVARKRSPAKVKGPPEAETMETILAGGKGTAIWEAYWRLASIFGPSKNPSPKRSARLYADAVGRMGLSHEHIHAKAQVLAKNTGNPKYLPQLATWLEGEGYLNPDPKPQSSPGIAHGNHHRSASDAELLAQIGADLAS